MQLRTRENFVDIFKEKKYLVGAEVGVRRANYSELLLSNYDFDKFYVIDPWSSAPAEGSSDYDEREGRERLSKFPKCEIIKLNSVDAAKTIEDSSIDFIYIDACHQYEYVKEDIKAWYPKLRTGGILAGHDYCNDAWPGVVKAVNEMVEELKVELFKTGIGSTYGNDAGDGARPSWWFYKG